MSDLVTAVTIGCSILGGAYALVQFGDRLWLPKRTGGDQKQQLMDATVRLLDSMSKLNHVAGSIAQAQALASKDHEYRHDAVIERLDKIEELLRKD